MSGVAKDPGGEWWERIQQNPLPPKLPSLIDSLLPNLHPTYSQGKKEATRIYLSWYALEMMALFQKQD